MELLVGGLFVGWFIFVGFVLLFVVVGKVFWLRILLVGVLMAGMGFV